MATRDRSQGVRFVFANPRDLLRHIETQEGNVVEIKRPFPVSGPSKASQELQEATLKLQANIARLQEMQSKIHFMLHELEKSTPRKS